MTEKTKSKYADLTNEQISAEISKHLAVIEELRSCIKKTPDVKVQPLHVLNASAIDERKQKFSEAERMKKAVRMAVERANTKKAGAK